MSTKYLNSDNILKKVYDPSAETLRTTAVASFVGGSVDISISDLTDSIKIGDGSGVYLDINPDGSINANVEVDAADGDNIAISDGTNTLAVNPNGSINVNLTDDDNVINQYNEITSVPSAILTTILTYAPANNGRIHKISVSGTNIAEYQIQINAVVREKIRTYFGNSLNYTANTDIIVNAGEIITIKVIHNRPTVADFNASLEFLED